MDFYEPISWRKKRSKPKVIIVSDNIYVIREYIKPMEFYLDNERLKLIGSRYIKPCFEKKGRLYSFRVLSGMEELHRHTLLVKEKNVYYAEFRGRITDSLEVDAIYKWMRLLKIKGTFHRQAYLFDRMD